MNYPPFCDIINVKFQSKDEKEIEKVANYFHRLLVKKGFINCNIYKPVPAPIDKIKNQFRWRFIIKCKLTKTILKGINECLEEFYKTRWKKTSIVVDINPNNLS
ncbi:MAG: hypothetical protein IKF52_04495 [Clostridia bacterium]|nr:hypothetical protein [Clostridia bacterium]